MPVDPFFEFCRFHNFPFASLIPGTASVALSFVSYSGGVVIVFVHQAWCRRYVADRKLVFAQARLGISTGDLNFS